MVCVPGSELKVEGVGMGWMSRNQQGHWMPQSLQRPSKASRPDSSSSVKLDTTIPGDCSSCTRGSCTRGCFVIQISALTLGTLALAFLFWRPPPPISCSSLPLPRTEPRSTGAILLADFELHFDFPVCATLSAVLGGGRGDEPCVHGRQSRTLGTLLKQGLTIGQAGLELMAFFWPQSSKAGITDHPSHLYLFVWVLYFCLSLPNINHRQAEAPS